MHYLSFYKFVIHRVTELNSKSTKRATIEFVHEQNRGYYYMSHPLPKAQNRWNYEKKI
jgi:hypothetical protein